MCPTRPPVTASFFFSSRRRHTRWTGDWVQTCALPIFHEVFVFESDALALESDFQKGVLAHKFEDFVSDVLDDRSEERRVGKECRYRWVADCQKKNVDRVGDPAVSFGLERIAVDVRA